MVIKEVVFFLIFPIAVNKRVVSRRTGRYGVGQTGLAPIGEVNVISVRLTKAFWSPQLETVLRVGFLNLQVNYCRLLNYFLNLQVKVVLHSGFLNPEK